MFENDNFSFHSILAYIYEQGFHYKETKKDQVLSSSSSPLLSASSSLFENIKDPKRKEERSSHEMNSTHDKNL
jgi:hypothetical protein